MSIVFNRCFGCMEEFEEEGKCPHCGYDPSEESVNSYWLRPGTILNGQYVVGVEKEHGSHTVTYLGWDLNLAVKVMIKEYFPSDYAKREPDAAKAAVIIPEDQAVSEDFFNGMRLFWQYEKDWAQCMDIPEVFQVRNLFQENNTAYSVLELTQGILLDEYVEQKGGRLDPEESLSIMRPIIRAMGKLHRMGIVHGNIVPDRLFMQADGELRLAQSNDVMADSVWRRQQDTRSLCAIILFCLTGNSLDVEMSAAAIEELPLKTGQREILRKGVFSGQGEDGCDIETLYLELYDRIITESDLYRETDPIDPADDPIQRTVEDPVDPTDNSIKDPVEEHIKDPVRDPIDDAVSIHKKNKTKFAILSVAGAAILLLAAYFISGRLHNKEGQIPADEETTKVSELQEQDVADDLGAEAISGPSNGNAANISEFYFDPEGDFIYYTDPGGALCYARRADDGVLYYDDVEVLVKSGAASLSILSDCMFFYDYENGAICRADLDGGNISKVKDVAAYDTDAGNAVYYFRAARRGDEEKLYFIEYQGWEGSLWRMNFDGTEAEILEKGNIFNLNLADGYIYYIGEELDVWRMKEDGTEKSQVYKGDRIMNLQVNDGELYMMSYEGKSFLIADLEGNILREIPEIDINNCFNYADGWIYYNNAEGHLCKSRKDGTNTIQLAEFTASKINISGGYLYTEVKEVEDYSSYYLISTDGSFIERVNPLDKDYKRGNTDSNLVNSGRFYGSPTEDGVYYCTDSAGKLYRSDKEGFELLYNGRAKYINVYDDYVYFYTQNKRICRVSPYDKELEVLMTDVVANDLTLLNDRIYFFNSLGVYYMDLESRELTELYKPADDETMFSSMHIVDGNIFFIQDRNLYKLTFDGTKTHLFGDGSVYRVRIENQKLYVDNFDELLVMDYDGNIEKRFENTVISGSNMLNVVGGWLYLYNFENEELLRLFVEDETIETLITGVDKTIGELNVADSFLWFRLSEDKKAYSITVGSEPVALEDCYSVDAAIQAGIK